MPHPSIDEIGLDAVEKEIATPSGRLTFPPVLEATFESRTADARLLGMIGTAIAAVTLYDVFLINDWLSLHDKFQEMLVARLFVFTPFMSGVMLLAHRKRSAIVAEWTTAAGAALAVLLPMSVMVFSDSTHKLSYQYGSVLVMMFATVIQRVRVKPALAATIAILIIQLTADYVSGAFDKPTYTAIVSFFGAAAALQAMAVYAMEKAERRTFLFALRGSLLHAQLLVSARTDALTGLYNRRHLADVKKHLWTATEPFRIAAILIDIDHFKLFNDTRGHLNGDECLRVISRCIKDTVGCRGHSAFRYGGEELLVLLPGGDQIEARRVAEDIKQAIATAAVPHTALGQDAVVTASFGIASVMAPAASAAFLISAADTALYAAKRSGRNCIWPPQGRPVSALVLSDVAEDAKRA